MLHWETCVYNVTVVRFLPFLIRSSFNNIFYIVYTLLYGPKFKICEIGKIDPPFLEVKK